MTNKLCAESMHWTLKDIPWSDFSWEKVEPGVLAIIKAASLVEYNAGDYEQYLLSLFGEDEAFVADIHQWTKEEVQHGEALAQWAKMADPTFDFEKALASFRERYQVPQGLDTSVRGTLTGELVARCVIETGTSSYYTAIKDMTQEPVLRAICARIAADEFRHYKLFYDYLQKYITVLPLARYHRFRIAVDRLIEAEDDELATAYYVANYDESEHAYDRTSCAKAYLDRVYGFYRKEHVKRSVGMIMKASGLQARGILPSLLFQGFWALLFFKVNVKNRFG